MNKQLLILIICIFSLSCNNKYKELKKGLPFIIIKLSSNISLDSSGNNGLAVRLYEDGTYSHFAFNFYAYGNWNWDDKNNIITLKPTSSKDTNYIQQYNIEKRGLGNYTIKKVKLRDSKIFVEKNENMALGLNASLSNDPFLKENNTWRIQPTKSESKQEIKIRTLKYLQFLIKYYSFIQDNKIDYITYNWYATPIQMHYGNGVRMSYNNELTDWYSCFYNIDEGIEGYKLISGAMMKCKIEPIESKTKRNIKYLEALIDVIEKKQS